MFDIGALELLLIVVVAIVVIGPKDMPQALRVAGRWIGKIRRASAQFRSGFDNLVREAEMEEMEKKWKEQNARIMAESPDGEMGPLDENGQQSASHKAGAEAAVAVDGDTKGKPEDLTKLAAQADAATSGAHAAPDADGGEIPETEQPMLPLRKPGGQ